MTVFFVALARIVWAFIEVKPVGLHPARRAETFLAETVHWALYLSLVVVPLSGWVHHAALDGFAPILWPFGQGLPMVPKSEAVASAAGAVHWLFTKVLFASVALHIAGALKHAIVDRDLVLARMAYGAEAGEPGGAPQPCAGAGGGGDLCRRRSCGLADRGAGRPGRPGDRGGGACCRVWRELAGGRGHVGPDRAPDGGRGGGHPAGWTAVINFDEATGTGSVRVEIDVATLTLGAVTDQAKGPEFFDVATHPTAVFSGDIAPAGEAFEARGTLSLRGVEVPVTLPFTLAIEGTTARMAGALTLDRRDFGMGKSYADEVTVGFPVAVSVALTATKVE